MENFKKWFKEKFKKDFDNAIDCGNSIPFDSYDRMFALYLLDNYPNLVNKYSIEKSLKSKELATEEMEKLLNNDDLAIIFKDITNKAYANYEREWISDVIAIGNLINVAKKGTEAVLIDSYYTGGWFGSS